MVFIHETHVMPSSGKVKTKRHLFSYLVISGISETVMFRHIVKINVVQETITGL